MHRKDGLPKRRPQKRKPRTEHQRLAFDVSNLPAPPQYSRELRAELKRLREIEGSIIRSITGRLS